MSRSKMLSQSRDDKEADSRMELIIEAINQKDKEILKSIFSSQALGDAEDFEQSVKFLFDFFKGENVTFKRQKQRVSEKINNGDTIKEVKTWYYVNTEAENYLVFLFDYTKYSAEPENKGLYAMRIIKAADKDKYFQSSQKMKIPGIYIPGS